MSISTNVNGCISTAGGCGFRDGMTQATLAAEHERQPDQPQRLHVA